MSTEKEFDYQAYMRDLSRIDENASNPVRIHRGPEARQKRWEAAKTQNSQKDQGNGVWKIIHEIAEKSANGNYIYRGEPECFSKVSSNLYRQYEQDIETKYFDIEVVQKQILEEAKQFTTETDEFEILTQLQHYGGKTNLIDFTTDFLVALFFACDGAYAQNGRIIMVDRTLLARKTSMEEQVRKPRHPQNRVISQKSVFVQPRKGFVESYETIIIPKYLKRPMLNHLKKCHNLSTETIYNDLHGFIVNRNIHKSSYTEFHIAYTYQNKGNHQEAINHYNKSVELNPTNAAAYNNRGNTKAVLGWYEEAIADYDEAIRINSQYALAYSNRGNAKVALGRYEEAIADYDDAIRINPQYAPAYSSREDAINQLQGTSPA